MSIKNKKSVGKKIQLNLSDGRNILVDKDAYKTKDSLIVELPEQKIADHLPFTKGAMILLTGGRHMGTVGNVESIEGNTLVFKTGSEVYETTKDHAFVVGKEKPAVSIQ